MTEPDEADGDEVLEVAVEDEDELDAEPDGDDEPLDAVLVSAEDHDPGDVGPGDLDPGREILDVSDATDTSLPVPFRERRLPETLSALNVFLARLKDVEILPMEEQTRLADEFQRTGNREAAAKLVASNLRLVVKIAFQFRRQWADVMDLVAEGNLGLAEAIRKFDVDRGIPFPSYARYWIRARILAFIQENKHLIHAGSRAARKLFWRLERERRRLVHEGHEATSVLLAERLGVRPEDVTELAPILDYRPVSLDMPAHGDEDGRTRGEMMADQRGTSPEESATSGQMQDQLQQVLAVFRDTLDDRDRAIWDRRLMADEPERLEDLGDRFGVSKERVRQLEVRIKARLKKHLQQNLDEDVIVEVLR